MATMGNSTDMVWHEDGHRISLQLNRADLTITTVVCPHPEKEGPCWHEEYGCSVSWFLMRFGLDCHVGVVDPSSEMTIAWSWAGDRRDIEASQVWIISTDDELYAAWSVSQRLPGDF